MRTAVADLLPLPALEGLTNQQRRGAACVWDGSHSPLTATTAIDLGERQDDGNTCFLRGCKPCAQSLVIPTLQDHTNSCEQCVDNYLECETGRSLVRLVRETRR